MRTLIALLLMATVAWADPFLTNDPPGECGTTGLPACPVKAEIFIDGVSVATDVALQPDMTIMYDLVTMPTEEHEYTAKYYDSVGRASVTSNPYLLLKTVSAPQNLRATLSPSP